MFHAENERREGFEEVKGCRGDLCTKNILRGREKFNFRIAFESGLDF